MKVSICLKYLLLLNLLFFHFQSKAQYIIPIDTIPKHKKIQLLKFGENISTELLAEKTLRLFRELGDGVQDHTKVGFYKIVDINSDPTNIKALDIPIDIINSLNKKEFAEQLLVLYADSLSNQDLLKLNKMFKTKDGIKLVKFTRNAINEIPSDIDFDTTGFFTDIEFYNAYLKVNMISEYIYKNMMSLLYSYIEKKTKANELKFN